MTEIAERQPVGFALLHELERAGAVTRVALTLTDPNLPKERWLALGRLCATAHSAARFYLGDLANFAEVAYEEGEDSDRYDWLGDATGLTRHTIENYASVCRRVTRSRRRESLTFGHHEVVARLEPELQSGWLIQADEQGWTRDRLRDELRRAQVLPPAPEQPEWSEDWRSRQTTTVGPLEPSMNGTGAAVVRAGPPVGTDTTNDMTEVVVVDRDEALRAAVRALVGEAVPIDDEHYRIPRARVRGLAALIEDSAAPAADE